MTAALVVPVTVITAREDDAARWDAYVFAAPKATFFHRYGWRRVFESVMRHPTYFLLATRGDQVVGVLPLAQVKSILFGNTLASLPFCASGGIVADDAEAESALNAEAVALAERLGVGHLEYRSMEPSTRGWPTSDLYFTFRKDILPDVEANMNAIPRKQRAMVRKAIKAELKSEFDSDCERFFRAYSESVHRLGTPVFAKRWFQALQREFGDACTVLTIAQGNDIVASVMSFYFRDQVLPYYGGGTHLARDVAGNDFMYWELMRRSCEAGIKVFDYGRSKRGTGAFDFKKNWGFEPTPLPYEYKLIRATAVPEHNPLNPKYQRFIKLWQRLPLGVANALGPHIVRQLG